MVPHETTETFGELIAGYQPSDDTQVVVWGTALDRDSDIPGSVTPISLGDTDDTRDFRGYDAVLAVRQRLSSEATVTGKYSYRRAAIDSRNPDALTGGDTNPFRRLKHTSDTHSGEVRLDVDSSNDVSLRAGFSFAGQERTGTGTVGAVDPGTGAVVFSPFRSDASPGTVTMWGEVEKRFNAELFAMQERELRDDMAQSMALMSRASGEGEVAIARQSTTRGMIISFPMLV